MFRVLTPLACLILVLPLIGSGCTGDDDTQYATYSVGIETAVGKKEIRQAALNAAETDLQHLHAEVGIQAETAVRGDEAVTTELNGVLSTLRSEWHLYINNTLHPFTHLERVPVRASDTIEWKYEEAISN